MADETAPESTEPEPEQTEAAPAPDTRSRPWATKSEIIDFEDAPCTFKAIRTTAIEMTNARCMKCGLWAVDVETAENIPEPCKGPIAEVREHLAGLDRMERGGFNR